MKKNKGLDVVERDFKVWNTLSGHSTREKGVVAIIPIIFIWEFEEIHIEHVGCRFQSIPSLHVLTLKENKELKEGKATRDCDAPDKTSPSPLAPFLSYFVILQLIPGARLLTNRLI